MGLIAQIPKNNREELRISRETFKGHDLINLRVFFAADDGDMCPGRQGLAFRVDILPDIIAALSESGSKNG